MAMPDAMRGRLDSRHKEIERSRHAESQANALTHGRSVHHANNVKEFDSSLPGLVLWCARERAILVLHRPKVKE